MATIDSLIHELRAEGSVDSQGRFTLDREQARAKMQKFQLVDARRYVLELVQAAVLRDATNIAFTIDADDMRMRFDGDPFTASEVDDLYGSVFSDGDSRRLRGVRQLALALNAALGLHPKFIRVRTGAVELRMAPGVRDEIIAHDKPVTVTEIHVRQRLRARVFLDFFKNLIGRIGEEQHLRARCVYSTVPITLDGVQISQGLSAGPEGTTSLPVAGSNYRGRLELGEHSEHTELRLVKDGVWIDTKTLHQCGTHMLAVIEGDNLRKDVSQAKIVENAALEQIVAALVHARWTMWRRILERHSETTLGRLLRGVVGEQLLAHASPDELRDHPDARALTNELAWPDCRDPSRQVTLAQLLELAAAGKTPSFSSTRFAELGYADPPVVFLPSAEVVGQLGVALEVELVVADDLLARERRRKLGQQAWSKRAAKPELPSSSNCTVRAKIDVELDAGRVRGEIGLDDQALGDPTQRAPIHLFMTTEGRLLGRDELELGIPNLWLAIEAPFTPTDDFTNAVRDDVFARSLLHGLAALIDPLVARLLAAGSEGGRKSAQRESALRGLTKRMLITLVDPASQRTLLSQAGVARASDDLVPLAELVPELAAFTRQSAPTQLTALPLFEDLAGDRRSLAQLAERLQTEGKLRFVDTRKIEPHLREPDVLFLGPGDRKLVRALFGEACLEPWDPRAKQRELDFSGLAAIDLAAERAALAAAYAKAGVHLPNNWILELPNGPIRGFVAIRYEGPNTGLERLGQLELQLRLGGRSLGSVAVANEGDEFGPILAVVDHPNFRPNATFDGVLDDAALAEAIAAVRAVLPALHRRASDGLHLEPLVVWRWLARVLLHAAAAQPVLREHLQTAPICTTVDGRRLSLRRVATLAREHQALEVVSRSLGQVEVGGAPVLAVDDAEIAELEAVLGVTFFDGTARVRNHQLKQLLGERPPLEPELDAEQVWASVTIRRDQVSGEVGLARGRTDASLCMTLGTAGRLVGELVEPLEFPLDAVVLDERLPIDAHGNIEIGHERVRELVRHCAQRVPALIEALCKRWAALSLDERTSAWPLLLRWMTEAAEQARGGARKQAFEASKAVPGFRDVRGRQLGLTQLLAEARGRRIDVLTAAAHAHVLVELPDDERLILIVDAREVECLAAFAPIRTIDEFWEAELAAIRASASAPKLEKPNIHALALVRRKAMVAGGLEAELWLARQSVFEASASTLQFVRTGRVFGSWHRPEEALPCAGLLHGDSLQLRDGAVVLDDRQVASLDRQRVILYNDLATRFANGQVAKQDHAYALEHLAWAAAAFADSPAIVKAYGKHGEALRKALAKLVPPALKAAIAGRIQALRGGDEPASEPAPIVAQPAPIVAQPAPVVTEPVPTPQPVAEPAPRPTRPDTPEHRLLAAIHEQLDWARARHPHLHPLLLDGFSIVGGLGRQGELASLDRGSLTLHRDHPIVARVLGQRPIDPIDLSFVIAALYSQLNYEDHTISDDDEREFVAQLAETLAIATRT